MTLRVSILTSKTNYRSPLTLEMPMPTELDLDIEPVTDSMGGSDEAGPAAPVAPAWEPPKGNWSELELCFLRIQDGVGSLDDFHATNSAHPNRLERESENNRIIRVRAAVRHAVTGEEFDRLVRESEDIAARNKVTIQRERDELSDYIASKEATIRKLESETSAAAFKAKLAGDARETLRANCPAAAMECYAQRSRAISQHYHANFIPIESELKRLAATLRTLKENPTALAESIQRPITDPTNMLYHTERMRLPEALDFVRSKVPQIESRIRELEPIVATARREKADAEEALRRETIDAYTGG